MPSACMPTDIGADFVIENVATPPKYGRRGLIGALIHEILRDAVRMMLRNRPPTKHPASRCTMGASGLLHITRALKID